MTSDTVAHVAQQQAWWRRPNRNFRGSAGFCRSVFAHRRYVAGILSFAGARSMIDSLRNGLMPPVLGLSNPAAAGLLVVSSFDQLFEYEVGPAKPGDRFTISIPARPPTAQQMIDLGLYYGVTALYDGHDIYSTTIPNEPAPPKPK